MNHSHPNRSVSHFLLLALIAVAPGCSSKESQAVVPSLQTVSDVAVAVAQKVTVPDWIDTIGTVRAAQTVQIGSQAMGNLVEVRVHEGDRVERDELLAQIDDAQPRAALNQALAAEAAAQKEVSVTNSAVELAESTLRRYQQLYDKKSVSPQEFDEIKNRRQTAQAQQEVAAAAEAEAAAGVAQARKVLANTQVLAPFSGVVTEKKVDAGSLAVPGMPLLTVEDTSGYRLEASLDESDIHSVRLGQTVPVRIDALSDKDFSGKVAQIVPAADPGSRTFLVKIALPPVAGQRSGLFGRARFARGVRAAILVPRTAIVGRGQLQEIYVVAANQLASLRYVTLGESANDQVEVLSGLEAGEKLIAAPGDRDFAGKTIEARP